MFLCADPGYGNKSLDSSHKYNGVIIKIDHLKNIFELLLLGLSLAIVICLYEKIYKC